MPAQLRAQRPSQQRARVARGSSAANWKEKGSSSDEIGLPARERARVAGGSWLAERVADAAHGLDQTGLVAGLGLAPQVSDVDVERVRREAEVVTPHALEDDRPREDLARIHHEELEQRELGARELDRIAVAPHLTRPRVELQVGEAKNLVGAVGGPAQQRADPGDELLQGERLRHVVVGARIEPGHPVLDLVAGRQHQHGHTVSRPAQTPADLEPVDDRHQHVEDDGVRLRLAVSQARQRLAAVGRQLDLVSLELECALERLADRAFIVYDEDSHGPIVRPEAERLLREPRYGLATDKRALPWPLRAWTRMR